MKKHSNFASRIFGILAIAATVGWLQPTAAYGQTAENTVIANTATVSFDDANGNSYGGVSATANVTVGFAAGVDVTRDQPTLAPLVNTGGNIMEFDVTNMGNGVDTMSVSDNISDGFLSVTQFTFNSLTYGDIAALNVALALYEFVAGNTMRIEVEYTVADNTGGESSTYTLTATSKRDVAVNDSFGDDNTVVTPALTGVVETLPKGAQTLSHLPNSGTVTTYTFTFTVDNKQTGQDDFDLLATKTGSGAIFTIESVNGESGDSARVTLAAGSGPTNFDVIYTVAGSAGTVDTLFLQARSVADPGGTNDSGFADMTIIEADLSITKVAYESTRNTPIGSDLVLPDDFIEYLVTVTNDGTAQAADVVVTDDLPATLTYISRLEVVGTWDVTGTLNDRTFTLNPGTLNAGASVSFWIRAQVN